MGTRVFTASAVPDTVNYIRAGAQPVKTPTASTYHHLQFSGSGAKTAVAGGAFATACQAGPTSQVVAPLPGTLAGFRVNVECGGDSPATVAAASAVESPDHPLGSELRVYTLTSTATQGTLAATDYVERQMTVTIAQ